LVAGTGTGGGAVLAAVYIITPMKLKSAITAIVARLDKTVPMMPQIQPA
jgi:hypothetical protein